MDDDGEPTDGGGEGRIGPPTESTDDHTNARTEHNPARAEPEGTGSGTSRRNKYILVGAALAVIAIFLGTRFLGNQARLTELAEDTCAELDTAIVLQVGGILSGAISDADDLGYSGPELGNAMRETCPLTMAAIANIGAEQDQREALPDQIRITTDKCGSKGASGTIRNNSEVTVDVWVGVQYLDSGGVIVEDGLDNVDRIRPGETAKWEDEKFSSMSGVARCRAEVSSVFES